jgi:hypothetical protein
MIFFSRSGRVQIDPFIGSLPEAKRACVRLPTLASKGEMYHGKKHDWCRNYDRMWDDRVGWISLEQRADRTVQ